MANSFQDGWFLMKVTGETANVQFMQHQTHRFWPPAVLQDMPLPVLPPGIRNIHLEGPGSVWMYAHTAAWAVHHHAVTLTISVPQESNPISLLPYGQSDYPGWLEITCLGAGIIGARLKEKPDHGRWAAKVLSPLDIDLNSEVHISGRGAVWMFAAVAARAVQQRASRVSCFQLREGGFVQTWPTTRSGQVTPLPTAWRIPFGFPETPDGWVLGICGDPNSGKSVLSYAIDLVRTDMGLVGWRLDCDGGSPTPPWYRDMVNQGRVEEGRALRSSQKRSWSGPMEQEIARQIENSRQSLDLLVADLPGGIHHTDAAPERVPVGREELFKRIHSFLILGRQGVDGWAEGWLWALEQHGLSNRVIGILTSSRPMDPPSLRWTDQRRGLWRGEIQGLDRQKRYRELLAGLRGPIGELLSFFRHPLRMLFTTKNETLIE